jgi:hypothetical protein
MSGDFGVIASLRVLEIQVLQLCSPFCWHLTMVCSRLRLRTLQIRLSFRVASGLRNLVSAITVFLPAFFSISSGIWCGRTAFAATRPASPDLRLLRLRPPS